MCFLFFLFRLFFGKIVGVGFLFVGGGIGGIILYVKWDFYFRESVEKIIFYLDRFFEMVFGFSFDSVLLLKKSVRVLNCILVYFVEYFEK